LTDFDERVVPHFLYARQVIVTRRLVRVARWERAAAACTADGQLDPPTLKRWHRRFQLDSGSLVVISPPAAHFQRAPVSAILCAPAESRSLKPSQEHRRPAGHPEGMKRWRPTVGRGSSPDSFIGAQSSHRSVG